MIVNSWADRTAGSASPLLTELLIQRIRFKDTAMRDFLDIFNHRIISLF